MQALNPDLAQVGVPALALGLRVRDDDVDAGQELATLHEGKELRGPVLYMSNTVVAERS